MLRRMKKILMLWMVLLLLTSSLLMFTTSTCAFGSGGQQKLYMDLVVPSSVYMETFFTITTYSANSVWGGNPQPIGNVTIELEWAPGEEYLTDENGEVSVLSPTVSEDTSFTVYASRGGFEPTSKSILICRISMAALEHEKDVL